MPSMPWLVTEAQMMCPRLTISDRVSPDVAGQGRLHADIDVVRIGITPDNVALGGPYLVL